MFRREDKARWWFQLVFIFTPKIRGRWTHFDAYFSNGLVETTNQKVFELFILWSEMFQLWVGWCFLLTDSLVPTYLYAQGDKWKIDFCMRLVHYTWAINKSPDAVSFVSMATKDLTTIKTNPSNPETRVLKNDLIDENGGYTPKVSQFAPWKNRCLEDDRLFEIGFWYLFRGKL